MLLNRNLTTPFGILALVAGLVVGCSKKEDKDETPTTEPQSNTEAPAPGAIMLSLDTALGSALENSASALRIGVDDFSASEDCKDSGTPLDAYYGTSDYNEYFWKCQFMKVPDGPDTVRGGVQRPTQVLCSVDKAIAAGEAAVDGEEHSFKLVIDDECWGESFAEMAAGELPDLVNADGYVEVDTTFTGYEGSEIPTSITTSDDWDYAFIVDWGFSAGDTTKYTVLVRDDAEVTAASILDVPTNEIPVSFAISLTYEEGDKATLRYDGRFPNSGEGETEQNENYGSRHVRAMVTGSFDAASGFTSYDSGSGASMEMHNNDANSDKTIDGYGYTVRSFYADDNGFNTIDWTGTGPTISSAPTAASQSPSTAVADAPANLVFAASAAQMAGFLHDKATTDYTNSEDWHLASGSLSFDEVEMGD